MTQPPDTHHPQITTRSTGTGVISTREPPLGITARPSPSVGRNPDKGTGRVGVAAVGAGQAGWHLRLFSGLVFAVLAATTIASLSLDTSRSVGRAGLMLCVVGAVTGLRVGWLLTAYPARTASRVNLAFFWAHGALVCVLCWLDPIFGFYAWVGFVDATLVLTRWWSLAGITVTALVVAACENDGLREGEADLTRFALLVVLNVGIAWSIGQLVTQLEHESEERRSMISRMERDMAEIEALQTELAIEARERGRLDERARVARDLHDTVAQGLVGIVAQLEAAHNDGRWRERATVSHQLAKDSLAEARRAIAALASPVLDSHRLSAAIEEVTRQWSAMTGIPLTFTSSGEEVDVAASGDVVRVCQEALSNIARHSDASRVVVELTYTASLVRLDIGDDGRGFDQAVVRPGQGLTGMAQRAKCHSGSSELTTQPGQGCVVAFTMPFDDGGKGATS